MLKSTDDRILRIGAEDGAIRCFEDAKRKELIGELSAQDIRWHHDE